jgi:hypothetical protein
MSAMSWVWLRMIMDIMNRLSNERSQWEKWEWQRMNGHFLYLPQIYV